MATSCSAKKPLSRFDLPGLNLPLNWQPAYNCYGIFAAREGEALFKTALNGKDVDDGAAS
jgi:hypothetical protein